ncbi:hypothetical protein C7M84_006072 [Penaeus vannamei]|uniref:Amino acid transporter transmembrane domain-containing protein n=1 Tax=Penaeus vannamei TaxID=6689 RepID=A0A3R7PS97_PENVA|nr:hypothetical protein C7M84_006072 [Penaeus vannamei]
MFMFIVSLPYAVLHGGYWALVAMIGIAYICCYTGKILVDCLYDLDENGQLVRVRYSYKGIAKEVFGQKWGGKIVNTAQLIELLMTLHPVRGPLRRPDDRQLPRRAIDARRG